MSWYHVEDTEPVRKNFFGWKNRTERGMSTETFAFSIWRCGHCRALAVVSLGDRPEGDCGKCKNK